MEFDYVGIIRPELLQAVAKDAPTVGPKDVWVERRLDDMFGSYDWTRSFDRPQILVYDEIMLSEILIIMHQWLRRRSARIDNIHLVVTHHPGIARWWNQWCNAMQERSFQIREWFFIKSPRWHQLFANSPALQPLQFYQTHKQISRTFSYYGGSWRSTEREYLALKFMPFSPRAFVDCLFRFGDRQELLAYAEHVNYYENQSQIEQLAQAYDQHVSAQGMIAKSPQPEISKPREVELRAIDLQGFQWGVDQTCWASVVRETQNNERFSCATEKTVRAFLHHCAVIPLGFRAVQDLEDLGFWFPHDRFDYSYQHEPLFARRIERLLESLDRLSQVPVADLQKHYDQNCDRFHANAQRIHHLIQNKSAQEQCVISKYIDDIHGFYYHYNARLATDGLTQQ